MASAKLLRGPLLLLLYQAIPLETHQDSVGRYRVSVGYGGGQWENETFGCQGEVLTTTPIRYRSGGAQLDAWPDPRLRLTAFGGAMTQSVGPTRVVAGSDSNPYVSRYNGPFGGAQLAYEGQRFGIGIGVIKVSGVDGFTAPSPYLRIGNIDKAHFRFDVLSPSPNFATTGWSRIGVGFNQGHLGGVGGFIGMGMSPVDYNNKVGLTGEARFPLGRQLAAQLQGLVGPGENVVQWSTAFAFRYSFGTH